jgi:hypothetical protein
MYTIKKQNKTNLTMKSTVLHEVVFNNTGKFERLSDFHKKIRQVLEKYQSAILALATKLDNGKVEYYNLTEVQSNMVMASIDINHLELVSEVFVAVKKSNLVLVTMDLKKEELIYEKDLLIFEANKARTDIEIAKMKIEAETILKKAEFLNSDSATSASVLLDEWGIDVTVQQFNKLLQSHFLLTKRNPKLVSKKGFAFGTNFTVGNSKQPRWYRHTFDAQLVHLGIE